MVMIRKNFTVNIFHGKLGLKEISAIKVFNLTSGGFAP